ncbi:hypothetical protein IU468_28470 [Nocardia farcinica]|uniref:hypothetical protein n=1 Tax=Nocardia farcinica TaxID=37329 RepID=UPI001895D92A|nr:hypothetical protein [Nocardia farcinica]MBF6260198.1 hypothetical protein [Nocardia farcinica]MBF6271190.1 hypothetical protein [Nocardia farcinica]
MFARPQTARPPQPSWVYRSDPYLLPPIGGDSGYATEGDVLVNRTADGVNLNEIWNELAEVLAVQNSDRANLASLVSFSTTAVADPIPQVPGAEHFEEASEFGEPTGLRAERDALIMGYDFKDYDLANRFTWKLLRDATTEQVRSTIDRRLNADNRNVNGTVLRRLFDNTQGLNEFQHNVYPLWNGDAMIPPPFAGQEEFGVSNHMLASGASMIDSEDLELLMSLLRSKGYGLQPDTRLLLLCNPAQGEQIAGFGFMQGAAPVPPRLPGEPAERLYRPGRWV